MQRLTLAVALGHAVLHHAVLCHAALEHVALRCAEVWTHQAMLQKHVICAGCQPNHCFVQNWALIVEFDYLRRCD